MRTLAFTLLAGSLLLGAACGDDDDDDAKSDDGGSDKTEYVEAMTKELKDSPEGPGLSDDQATCMATGLVDTLGVDKLKDADVTPKQLTEAEDLASLGIDVPADLGQKLNDSVADCDLAPALTDFFVARLGELGTLSEESAACLKDSMDGAALVKATMGSFADQAAAQPEGEAALTGALKACATATGELTVGKFASDGSAEVQACVAQYAQGNVDAAAAAIIEAAGSDPSAFQAALTTACPDLAAAAIG